MQKVVQCASLAFRLLWQTQAILLIGWASEKWVVICLVMVPYFLDRSIRFRNKVYEKKKLLTKLQFFRFLLRVFHFPCSVKLTKNLLCIILRRRALPEISVEVECDVMIFFYSVSSYLNLFIRYWITFMLNLSSPLTHVLFISVHTCQQFMDICRVGCSIFDRVYARFLSKFIFLVFLESIIAREWLLWTNLLSKVHSFFYEQKTAGFGG